MTAALLVLAAGLVFFFGLGRNGDNFVTSVVARGPLTVTVSATGSLQPETEVSVGAEISGRIETVNVDFNDRVTKDQVLAAINTDASGRRHEQIPPPLMLRLWVVSSKARTMTRLACGAMPR